jgi:hypothetical protein
MLAGGRTGTYGLTRITNRRTGTGVTIGLATGIAGSGLRGADAQNQGGAVSKDVLFLCHCFSPFDQSTQLSLPDGRLTPPSQLVCGQADHLSYSRLSSSSLNRSATSAAEPGHRCEQKPCCADLNLIALDMQWGNRWA